MYGDPENGGRPSSPAQVTNLNLSQPALPGNAVLSRKPNTHRSQSSS